MTIDSERAYEAAAARIRRLSEAREGTPEAAERAELIAAVQEWKRRTSPRIQGDASSPGHFNTARRPGQPGEEAERRAGPNPRSDHPSGPHTPYEPDDPEGIAAEKHRWSPTGAGRPDDARPEPGAASRPSGTIRIVDLKRD